MPVREKYPSNVVHCRWILVLLVSACLFSLSVRDCLAADPELVGLLALATEASSADTLELSDEQLEKLTELLDTREEAVLAEAMKVRTLEGEERAAALRPYRVESQRQMAGLLTDKQLDSLNELAAANPNDFYEPMGGTPAEETAATQDTPTDGPEVTDQAEMTEEPSAEDSESSDDEQQPAADRPEGPPQRGPGGFGRFGDRGGERPDGERPSFGRDRGDRGGFGRGGFGRRSEDESGADSGPSERSAPTRSVPATGGADPSTFPAADSDGKLTFSFRYQPWQDVLDWFAEQNGLSLLLESPPSGTFNYTDPRKYTPAEALDVLNSVLLTKGYTLVRRERMLVLVNLEDGIPPNLVTNVSLEELDKRGDYELIRVLFQVRNMTPEAASEEVSRLVGPQGSVVVLPRAGMLQVTETAGRIRAIREVIDAIENPTDSKKGDIKPYELEYASAGTVMPVLRQMLGIEAEGFSTPDGTLQLAVDGSTGSRLLAYGTPEMVKRLEEVLDLVDVPEAAGGPIDQLQLEVYPVNQADPEAVLKVLQTLLADEPGTRLATDPLTGNLVALASVANHRTIQATLGQMSEDARQIEVIPLQSVEPQLALLSITKLFGITSGEEADPRAPIVDADLSTNSLMVRGTKAQLDQIKALLGQMGESADSVFASTEKGNVRLLPLTSSEARSALQQLDDIWPTLRSNPIRMVSPANVIRSYRPSEQATPDSPTEDSFDIESMFRFQSPEPATGEDPVPTDRGTSLTRRLRAIPVGFQPDPEAAAEQADEAAESESGSESSVPAQKPKGTLTQTTPPASQPNKPSQPGAPILVAPGPNGLLIASDDLDALDAFERILEASSMQSTSGREYAVFYLKHAKAATAAAILGEMFGSAGGTGDSLMGGIADAALGDIGGGLMGDLLGLGGAGASTGFSAAGVDIVTDARLNALIVYARPDDIDMVFRLLQVLDQRSGPTDVEAEGVPRLIPVVNTSASQVADVVKTIFSDRLEGGSGGQPSPEDLMRMLRQGQGGGADAQEPAKMSIGVDSRSNSLVVRAPDPLFVQVEALVKQLDTEQLDSSESTQIVSLKYSNSSAIKEALSSILGSDAVTSGSQQTSGEQAGGGDRGDRDQARQREEFVRRIQEFRNRMQGGGRGGPPGGGRGGGGRGGRGGR
ncbi:hypothetical protein NG895_09945 [Aeoliella sp. ICT_H6.2]|uniref:NolW-like domain-containing protein n=1 Tax=Aeoliella straminimaris TaxID=2954799 RepID=A0A9X2F9V2_9BACT|nr:secretin N-terminal domain-containing protein [Aeoliella straminimaris]MCO6044227.1 hypothetical protein [Aeoliella straminimaris]